MSIQSLKKSGNSLQFKIANKGDYPVALVNGLRRAILMNLDSFCFDREDITFRKNTSIYNEDFLTQRLSLIPLNAKKFAKLDLEKVEAYLLANNTTELVEPKSYYAKDIKLYLGEPDTPLEERQLLNTSDYITHPDILLMEIKPDQEMECFMKVRRGTHKENGAMYCPVSKCVYFFEPDEKAFLEEYNKLDEAQKKEMAAILKEQIYQRRPDGSPAVYNFQLETDGILPVQDVFVLGCDYISNLLKAKIDDLKNLEASTMVKVETSPTNMKGYDFVFELSDDTLGNILQTYALKDKDIHYIGYHVPHPLDRRLYVRMSLENANAGLPAYVKKMSENMQAIVKIVDGLKKSYLNALK